MSPPLRVALIGIDGSGKSTLARSLARALTESGQPATYFENAGGRPTMNRFAQRLGYRDAVDLLGPITYLALEAAIRGVLMLYALVRSWWTRHLAVMDRYVYCQYAAIRARRDPGEAAVRRVYRWFPQPDLVCYLAVDPVRAQRRIDLRGIDHEDLEYLVAADNGYRSLPEWARFVVVDANQPADVVLAEVLRRVQDLYRPSAYVGP